MKFAPGQVVKLKSGGQPMTVVAVYEDTIECIWVGEEGDLFRETIPGVALERSYGRADGERDRANEPLTAESEMLGESTRTRKRRRRKRRRRRRRGRGRRREEEDEEKLRRKKRRMKSRKMKTKRRICMRRPAERTQSRRPRTRAASPRPEVAASERCRREGLSVRIYRVIAPKIMAPPPIMTTASRMTM